jgi:NitT/TauT family transport system permease protein
MSETLQQTSDHFGAVRVGRGLSLLMAPPDFWLGIFSLATAVAIWELGARSEQWLGVYIPRIGALPPPDLIFTTWFGMLWTVGYWTDVLLSFWRVLVGFGVAMLIGIPLGLWLALNRIAYGVVFPPFEVLRPIPPIAWVPASIIFWPTQDLSILFVTFLGAFFTVVLNVLGGTRSIDIRYVQAASSMGSSRYDIFRRIILPAVLPSVIVGALTGIGITWEVVIAAELISGGGSAPGGSGGGLGFFIWNAYVAGGESAETDIIVGMLSIGVAGYLSSAVIRRLGEILTPWLRDS